jgi:glycosyltransferase involved in cell wall biosynthesis
MPKNILKQNIKLSVVMPAYNAEKYIRESIDSILNQTLNEFEFIIIDDFSSDKTWEIIKEYSRRDNRIICYRNDKNLKISHTLNKAINICKTDLIVRMDADDISLSNRLEILFKYMNLNPETVCCGSYIEICDEDMKFMNTRSYPTKHEDIIKMLNRVSPFCHASLCYRKSVIEKSGMYNSNLVPSEDYDLYFRLVNLGRLHNINEILYKVRTHNRSSSNLFNKKQAKLTFYIKIKAMYEYNNKFSTSDKIYLMLHFLSIILIPTKFQFKIFNKIRNSFLIINKK